MEHFITLFDSLFLPQGLALHRSMQRHLNDFTLWVLCMDERAFELLTQLDLANVKLLRLADVETPALLAVKPDRAINEYCWTVTPFTPRFVFEADPEVTRATYLDADLWFMKSPDSIFAEFSESGKQVLITEHAYSPECDESEASGIYCVQFMCFTRDGGESVRAWWQARCLEWCYERFEDGKFGDQKYLDDWTERFPDQVHVLGQKQSMLAPWNIGRFDYNEGIVWHFQALRIQQKGQRLFVDFGAYKFPADTIKYVYEPYLEDLRHSVKQLLSVDEHLRSQAQPGWKRRLKGHFVTIGAYIQ